MGNIPIKVSVDEESLPRLVAVPSGLSTDAINISLNFAVRNDSNSGDITVSRETKPSELTPAPSNLPSKQASEEDNVEVVSEKDIGQVKAEHKLVNPKKKIDCNNNTQVNPLSDNICRKLDIENPQKTQDQIKNADETLVDEQYNSESTVDIVSMFRELHDNLNEGVEKILAEFNYVRALGTQRLRLKVHLLKDSLEKKLLNLEKVLTHHVDALEKINSNLAARKELPTPNNVIDEYNKILTETKDVKDLITAQQVMMHNLKIEQSSLFTNFKGVEQKINFLTETQKAMLLNIERGQRKYNQELINPSEKVDYSNKQVHPVPENICRELNKKVSEEEAESKKEISEKEEFEDEEFGIEESDKEGSEKERSEEKEESEETRHDQIHNEDEKLNIKSMFNQLHDSLKVELDKIWTETKYVKVIVTTQQEVINKLKGEQSRILPNIKAVEQKIMSFGGITGAVQADLFIVKEELNSCSAAIEKLSLGLAVMDIPSKQLPTIDNIKDGHDKVLAETKDVKDLVITQQVIINNLKVDQSKLFTSIKTVEQIINSLRGTQEAYLLNVKRELRRCTEAFERLNLDASDRKLLNSGTSNRGMYTIRY